jgi:hypothetical protein
MSSRSNRTRTALAVGLSIGFGMPGIALGQGIPAVSGVLKTHYESKVPRGVPPTLTLKVDDRPAAFYARCVFGSPEQEVVAESEALEAGKAFVVALPADTKARTAECAVVARFANGLSERKPVTMAWAIVDPPKEDAAEEPSDTPDTKATDDPAPADRP